MPTGKEGSTLTAELNRLAGITDITKYQDAQGAANVWASTTGEALVGALNHKVSAARQPNNYKGLNAVCNEIAGTTGLSAVVALRSINV
jgi:hypothetical protein